MTIKVVGEVDVYGDRLYLPTGAENTVDDSEFEAISDDAGTLKWLQADLSTWSTTPHFFAGTYAAAAGHVLVGFATPTPPGDSDLITVRGRHNDPAGDGSSGAIVFFAEKFRVQSNDVDDVFNRALVAGDIEFPQPTGMQP